MPGLATKASSHPWVRSFSNYFALHSRLGPRHQNCLIYITVQTKLITIVPVYNGEKFIRQTLDSLANQTLRPERVIVLDNCSTDGTERIVREFQPIKCEWIRNPTNLGLFGNFNR